MNVKTHKPIIRPKGFTLVELMIALTIMLMVSLVSVQISANVFNTNTQLIHMTQLTSELRAAIQIISRDVRRAGYDSDALAGFLTTQAIDSGVTMGTTDDNGAAQCIHINYDDISQGQSGKQANVVYRLRTVSGVGRLSVLFGDEDDSYSCDTSITDDDWVDLTDPLLIDITSVEFVHDDSFTDIAENLSNGNMIQVGLEQVSITITAELRSNDEISRTVRNEVQIRNQILRV